MAWGWCKFPFLVLLIIPVSGKVKLGKATNGGGKFNNMHVSTLCMTYLMNQNIFYLLYSKEQVFLFLLWIQYFSTQEKQGDGMWNFSSQDKQSSIKPKYFVALASLLNLLGGLLRDGGNGELNQPGISNLRVCQYFFCIKQLQFRGFQPSSVSSPKLLHYLTLLTYCMTHYVFFLACLLVNRKLSDN